MLLNIDIVILDYYWYGIYYTLTTFLHGQGPAQGQAIFEAPMSSHACLDQVIAKSKSGLPS